MTENLSEVPDEFHEILSRISKHSRQTASQRVFDWVIDVKSEPPQAVTTESNIVAESSNPPVVLTITEVVQSGYPIQLAALAPGLNTLPSEQQLNITAENFPRPVITNSSPPSLAAVNQLPSVHMPSEVAPTTSTTVTPATQTLSVPSQTKQFVIPVTSQPLLTINSGHANPNLSAWTFPAGNSLPITQCTAPPPTGGQFTLPSTVAAPIVTTPGNSVPVVSV